MSRPPPGVVPRRVALALDHLEQARRLCALAAEQAREGHLAQAALAAGAARDQAGRAARVLQATRDLQGGPGSSTSNQPG